MPSLVCGISRPMLRIIHMNVNKVFALTNELIEFIHKAKRTIIIINEPNKRAITLNPRAIINGALLVLLSENISTKRILHICDEVTAIDLPKELGGLRILAVYMRTHEQKKWAKLSE